MKIIYSTIQVVFIALMLGVAGLFLLPLLPIDNNVELRIVESGSMEPAIMTGSLVVIIPTSSYGVGDVVTFKSATADVPTTHRIIESFSERGENYFRTKGDANEEADTAAVAAVDVMGTIAVDVPYAGFILDFARQPIGFSLLILLPAFMIILSEIEKIWTEIRTRRKVVASSVIDEEEEKNADDGGLTDRTLTIEKPLRMMDIKTPVQYRLLPARPIHRGLLMQRGTPKVASLPQSNFLQWTTVCSVLIGSTIYVSTSFFPYTASYFNDVERTLNNALQSVMLDFKVFSEFNSFDFLGTTLASENSAVVNVVEPENGSAAARYDVQVTQSGGNPFFCNAIVADMAVLPTVYSGPLLNLAASDVSFSGPWSLALTLDEVVTGYLPGDTCQVDIVYTAWQQIAVDDVGYSDEERVSLLFTAPAVNQTPLARTAPSSALLELSIENVVPPEGSQNDNALVEVVREDAPIAKEILDEVGLPEVVGEVVKAEGVVEVIESAPEEVAAPGEPVGEEPAELPVPVVEVVEKTTL